MQDRCKKSLVLGFALTLMLLTSPVAIAATGQEEQPQQFGGVFDGLDSEQKRLVVDWIQRFNSIMGENRQAEDTYNSLPLSSRTTFDAVTHALGLLWGREGGTWKITSYIVLTP